MANKKMSRSQSSVPFSWEEKPGIPKFSDNTNTSHNTITIVRPLQKSAQPPTYNTTDSPSSVMNAAAYCSMKISPPPCNSSGNNTPNRSNYYYSLTKKGLQWRHLDDPFAAAMKECTKNIKHLGLPTEGKICIGSNGYSWNKKIVFSCKKSSSCDVSENNLVRLAAACNNNTKLPPLPCRERKKK